MRCTHSKFEPDCRFCDMEQEQDQARKTGRPDMSDKPFFAAKDLHGFSVKLSQKGEAWDGCNGGDELLAKLNAKLAPELAKLEEELRKSVETAKTLHGRLDERDAEIASFRTLANHNHEIALERLKEIERLVTSNADLSNKLEATDLLVSKLRAENATLLKDLEEAGQAALDSVPEIARLREALRQETESHHTIAKECTALREALEFYAEAFTWSRVTADVRAGVEGYGLDRMYGTKARAALKGEK